MGDWPIGRLKPQSWHSKEKSDMHCATNRGPRAEPTKNLCAHDDNQGAWRSGDRPWEANLGKNMSEEWKIKGHPTLGLHP